MARSMPVQTVTACGLVPGYCVRVCCKRGPAWAHAQRSAAAILNFNKVAASSETDSGTVIGDAARVLTVAACDLCSHTVFSYVIA